MKKLKLVFIITSLIFIVSCAQQEEPSERKDTFNLRDSILLKTNECGNHPIYPLFVAGGNATPSKRDVQACMLTIIQQKCPFNDYPYYCLKIYKNFEYENPLDKINSD